MKNFKSSMIIAHVMLSVSCLVYFACRFFDKISNATHDMIVFSLDIFACLLCIGVAVFNMAIIYGRYRRVERFSNELFYDELSPEAKKELQELLSGLQQVQQQLRDNQAGYFRQDL